MAENLDHTEQIGEPLMENIHGHDENKPELDSSSSSSSDSEDKTSEKQPSSPSSVKTKIWRLFGRQKPVHSVFGGGKPADVFLWRNKKISAGVLGVATSIWVLFELMEYHLLTLVCHLTIFALAILFMYSSVSTFINKSPTRIPEVKLAEEPFLQAASALRYEINYALSVLREVASGRDLKKFLVIIAGLWVLSVFGSYCNFLTLFYVVFVLLHTVPVLYEKYDDKIDAYVEKAMVEIKKQYAVFDAKVLSQIPRGPLKDKKMA